MTRIKKVAPIPDTHPKTVSDLAKIPIYHPFEWGYQQLRVVPCSHDGKFTEYPCRGCAFSKARAINTRCPAIQGCQAHLREDRTPVKFISADLSSLNYDEQQREAVSQIDLQLRW